MDIEEKFYREGVSTATLTKRAVAYFIDDVLVSLVVVVMLWDTLMKASDVSSYIAVTNSAFFEIVMIRFIYQFIFVLLYGATLGKQIMKIKIIDINTLDKPVFYGAISRAFVRTIGEVLFYFTFIFAFFDPYKRTLHDRVANTAVVNV
ncbi:MAG: RDD family protein [Campylobacterales bacterium]